MTFIIISIFAMGSMLHEPGRYWWYLALLFGFFLLGWLAQWLLERKAPRHKKWLLLSLAGLALAVDLVILVGMPFGWSGQVQWLLLYTLHWLPLGVVSLALGALLAVAVFGLRSMKKKEA